MRRLLVGLVAVPCVLLVSAAPALAADLRVAPRGASFGCAQNSQYHSIQAAVTAANPGDHITVCPGTYQENVTINKANLMLQSQQPLQATIKAPASVSNATVVSVTAPGVKIQGFTITVSGQTTSCDSVEYGVYVSGGGSADLEQNDISDIGDTPTSGCQNGIAVEAGDSTVPTTGSVTLKQDTIEDYQKGGVVVDGTGSSGDIENDTVIGIGPQSTIAGNGIQVSDGATATIKSDTVSNNMYVPPPNQTQYVATGILLCGQGSVDIENNTLSTNDVSLYDAASDSNGGCPSASPKPSDKIQNNTVVNSTDDGIVLDGENSAGQVKNNNVAGTWGYKVYGSDNGDGIDVFNTTGAQIQNNQAAGNSEDGLHNESNSTGNSYQGNQASTNLLYDCADDSANVSNTWQGNMGDINSPPFICKGNPAAAGGGNTPAVAAAVPNVVGAPSGPGTPSPAH